LSSSDSERAAARGLQVSLGGLIVLVLAAGVAAGVARSAREVWGLRRIPPFPASTGSLVWGSGQVPVERTAGVVLEIAAVFLLVTLARALIALLREVRPADPRERLSRAWRLVWRAAAACFLLWFIAEESTVLRIDCCSRWRRAPLAISWR
jgi:hypothetical protein